MLGLSALATGPARRQHLLEGRSAAVKRRRTALRRSHFRRAWRPL